MTLTDLPILFAALAALAYLPLSRRPPSPGRSFVKTAAVALLALAAALSGAPWLLVLALGLCALGDLALSRGGAASFQAGVAAFAGGHLAYMALFLGLPASDLALLIGARLWPTLALIGLGLVAAAVLAPRAGALRGAVLAYIPIILGMGLAALTLPTVAPLGWVLPAALAFIVSDLVLAGEEFVLPADHPTRRLTPLVIWTLYWGAQVSFLAALA